MIVAVIQARMGSQRLPGKVLLNLNGKPVLWHVVNRASHARTLDKVIVATTTNPEDNEIETFCRKESVPCFRGSADDVLDRYYQCVRYLEEHGDTVEFIVRITADCPVIDPEIIDRVVALMQKGEYDYASNVIPPTYPDGLDVEVFTLITLKTAYEKAHLKSEREHVTPFIINSPLMKKGNISHSEDLSFLRWTLDEPEDFTFITQVYEHLYDKNPDFLMNDILHLLNQYPEMQKINSAFSRNEGYRLSLLMDESEKEL
jgi:spore coat polysaccharide biosynthesis protein SpsF